MRQTRPKRFLLLRFFLRDYFPALVETARAAYSVRGFQLAAFCTAGKSRDRQLPHLRTSFVAAGAGNAFFRYSHFFHSPDEQCTMYKVQLSLFLQTLQYSIAHNGFNVKKFYKYFFCVDFYLMLW